jgi:hypothetical protein
MNILYLKNNPLIYKQCGSSLIIILVAIALFAALSYALSQQGGSGNTLSAERARLLASDVIDMGNKQAEAVARLRLKNISQTNISFENSSILTYTNSGCTTDLCRVFAFDGGGLDWETPINDINGGKNWGYSGDLSIQNIGSGDADLVALLPDISSTLCDRINTLLRLYDAGDTIPNFGGVSANVFTGNYLSTPVNLTSSKIDGQKSGCILISTATGTAFTGAPLTNTHVYYQVLIAR